MADSAETMREAEIGRCYKIGHDGFVGTVIGHYTTLEGKEGVVLQQVGTRVVHVYGRKWVDTDAALSASGAKSDGGEIAGRIVVDRRATSTEPGGVASDPIPSQPDEREAIARIINPKAFDESYWARGRQREKTYALERAADILAMQAERRGHDPLGDLVQRFADALLAKLRLAQANGRSGWDQDDWEEACRKGLMRHIEKGDPRDVAAYCAFMWHHGWSTAPPKPDPIAPLTEGSFVKGGHNSFPSQIKDRPAAPAPINKPPAQPAPIAGLEPVASLLDELREYTALRYAGDCKCGNCQLVPRATLDRAIQTMAQLEAHAAEQVRPLVEALEGLIEAVELDADEGLEGIGSYTGARLTDAKNAIRARGQV